MIPAAPSSTRAAVQALSAALGVPVSTRMPTNKPERFVILSRIGGGSGPFGAVSPRFLVECYAPTEIAAEEFGELVRITWQTMRTHGINRGYDDNNLAWFDAPDIDHCRFQFTGGLQILLQATL